MLLIDERDGSEIARRLGVKTIGTLGLLDAAAERGWLDLKIVFERLRATSFRAPIAVMAALLRKHNLRH
jgi:predicted nucleic acid-binding protein